MRDAWYFAEADKPPLSIAELKRILHRFKDWKERLVWHSSFSEWRKAEAVTELAVRADLLWDDEVRGLCLRVVGDGSKSFVFIYCVDGHQRFIRIGQSPEWSLEAARVRAQELHSIVDQGHDPRLSEYCKRSETPPVQGLIRYVADHTQTIPLLRRRAVGPNQSATKLLSKRRGAVPRAKCYQANLRDLVSGGNGLANTSEHTAGGFGLGALWGAEKARVRGLGLRGFP